MKRNTLHLSDEQLVREVDGETTAPETRMIRAHLDACWSCRARKHQLEGAVSEFINAYQSEFEAQQRPPSDGPRALLKAQMAAQARENANRFARSSAFRWLLAAAACIALALLLKLDSSLLHSRSGSQHSPLVVSVPDARLTPGAAVLVSRQQLCSQQSSNNKDVPEALRRAVFKEYGIAGAAPGSYEVDYLITPALGGADDIHNLWPQSYRATVWNARAKDALESHLRQMVCDGSLDLTSAQQQIAGNWIATYKQYFHTDKPLGP